MKLSCFRARQYAVYFPDGGEATLDISDIKGNMKANWLDIAQSKWETQQILEAGRSVALQSGPWVVLVSKMRAGGSAFKGPVEPQRGVQLKNKRGKGK